MAQYFQDSIIFRGIYTSSSPCKIRVFCIYNMKIYLKIMNLKPYKFEVLTESIKNGAQKKKIINTMFLLRSPL